MKAATNRYLLQKKRFWAGILLAQFLLFYLFSKLDFFINLSAGLFEFQKAVHQRIFAAVHFSVGDVCYIILAGLFIFLIVKMIRRHSRKKYAIITLIMLNVFYFIYQLAWGMLYFQPPIMQQLPKEDITVAEIKSLAIQYLNKCIETRKNVKEDQSGTFKITSLQEIKFEILQQQEAIPLLFNDKKSTGIDAFKPSLFSKIMGFSGILGYYNPFTAEAQYNALLPSTYLPFTLAHESAHQLGFAREHEANFIGYLIGKEATNPELRYSTQYFVLKSLLNALAEEHPDFVKTIIRQYSPGMKRDRAAERKHRETHEGIFEEIFGFTNDLFLKGNRQEGSITYSYFVDLLVRHERLK
ncbi:hypothetical protein CO230_09490 [Chryseobacterium sp. 6424]|nr:hypothetical protein CO230_09490 [Chryseobacterium sp. 6424]